MLLCARSTPGMRNYVDVVVGVAFSDPRVDGARRTTAVCWRRLPLVTLMPWVMAREAGGGALAVGGDQLGNVALVEALAQAPKSLRGCCKQLFGYPSSFFCATLFYVEGIVWNAVKTHERGPDGSWY